MKKLVATVLTAAMLTGAGLTSALGAETETAMTAYAARNGNLETLERILWTNGEGQLTETDIQLYSGGKAKVHARDGKVVFVEGNCAEGKVTDMETAGKVVRSMTQMLGGDPATELEAWREITDPAGNRYFIFQQMQGDTTVLGGAVKVIANAEGTMLGITSSIVNDLPDFEVQEGITAETAEQIILKHEAQVPGTELVPGTTRKIILPVTLDLDAEEADENSRFVWAVYTTNPALDKALPYLAHYVSMQGEYLYNMPTILPGDKASTSGYSAEYAFTGMEPVDYTGYVDLADGTEKEISVTLMRDKRTGMYYLGNIERKIAVADCWEFLYNGGQVVMESSKDNKQWEQKALLSLYNYCRAYDYYREIGWIGADGLGTPMLILNNFCDKDGWPVDNAAFAGQAYGWQIFLSSRANDMAQCLDVLAHEFTHCVTGATMTYNDYMNDRGAINEALSDIQGNICEMMYGATEDENWEIGETAQIGIRSMSDPHKYGQPEHTWDLYYDDNVAIPTAANDLGGVHTNSSLLNRVAWMLCDQGGMSLAEARAFWFAADCAMTPGTDYKDLADLLPFVLKSMGMSKYEASLKDAIKATKMGENDLPQQAKAGQSILTLKLPETEDFQDGNWSLGVVSLNLDALKNRIATIGLKIALGDMDDMPRMAQEIAKLIKTIVEKKDESSLGEILLAALTGGDNPEEAQPLTEEDWQEMCAWLLDQAQDLIYSDAGSPGMDENTIRMVSQNGYTIPYLTHLVLDETGEQISQMNMALWVHDRWVDVTSIMMSQTGESEKDILSAILDSGLPGAIGNAILSTEKLTDVPKALLIHAKSGEIVEIPNTGLEKVAMEQNMASMFNEMMNEETEVSVDMSRPKA